MSTPENSSDLLQNTIDCAVCGKKDITVTICPRCESDLVILRKITMDSEILVRKSNKALQAMNPERSLQMAIRSWKLKRNQNAAKAAFLSCCALGDFRSALAWYKRTFSYK